jgi:Adenylate and Guanylate cyclase catalytic domain
MGSAPAACGGCGTGPIRDGARFCHVCVAPTATTPEPAEYKQVTVLFADVVRSMDMASTLEPERLREIMAAVFDRSAVVVQRYGGTVDKFTGDGLMTLFGAPVALEDHALRGCLAALGILQEIKGLAAEVDARDHVALQLRVGLDSGQVVAGGIGTGRISYTAFGEHQRGTAGDVQTAQEMIDRLAAVPTDPGFVLHEIPLLRLRALVARRGGDQTGYRDWVDRYRATATACGFQGHMAIAEAMRCP